MEEEGKFPSKGEWEQKKFVGLAIEILEVFL